MLDTTWGPLFPNWEQKTLFKNKSEKKQELCESNSLIVPKNVKETFGV